MSFSQVEISGVESHRPLTFDSCCTLEGSAEEATLFGPASQPETGVWLSRRILPSDRDLLINDLNNKS